MLARKISTMPVIKLACIDVGSQNIFSQHPKPYRFYPNPSEPEYSPLQPNVEIPKQTAPTIPPKVIQDLTPEPDADLEDTSDLDKLKKDIMKTLEKLDQVEVE